MPLPARRHRIRWQDVHARRRDAREWSKAEQKGEQLPITGRIAHAFYEQVVYKKIRTIFGPTPTSPSPAALRWTPSFPTSSTASACRCWKATA